jgi:hypothetical protein
MDENLFSCSMLVIFGSGETIFKRRLVAPSWSNFHDPQDGKRYRHVWSYSLTRWPQHMDTIYIGWKRPLVGWIKLNCDGDYKKSVDLGGCGELYRDSYGWRWLKGYIRKNGTCDTLRYKMRGMYIECKWLEGIVTYSGKWF